MQSSEQSPETILPFYSISYHFTVWNFISLKFWCTLLEFRCRHVCQFEIWHNWQLRRWEKDATVTFGNFQNRFEKELFLTSYNLKTQRQQDHFTCKNKTIISKLLCNQGKVVFRFSASQIEVIHECMYNSLRNSKPASV